MAEYQKAIKTPIPEGGMGWYAIDQQEIDAVTRVLKNPKGLFRYAKDSECFRFERTLTERLGVAFALFVNSGTSALACCLSGFGIGFGDEVIVQAYTYIATASACIEVGAVPIIAEIDESLALDPADVEKKITPYTKAIIITHMQGVPGRVAEIRALAKKYGVYLIEDCCQAIGSTYHGKPTGVDSDAFAWSLNYFKNITCGEGGVYFSNSNAPYVRAFFQSDPAGNMWGTQINDMAPNVHIFTKSCYRANEVCAAIANVQLSKLDGMLAKTRALKKTLLSHLNLPIHYVPQHVDDSEGDCGTSFAMILNDKEVCKCFTDALAREGMSLGSAYSSALPDKHIYTYWDAIINNEKGNSQIYPWNSPLYKGNPGYSADMCPQSLDILSRSLRIGINLAMTEQNMIEFADAINKADQSV